MSINLKTFYYCRNFRLKNISIEWFHRRLFVTRYRSKFRKRWRAHINVLNINPIAQFCFRRNFCKCLKLFEIRQIKRKKFFNSVKNKDYIIFLNKVIDVLMKWPFNCEAIVVSNSGELWRGAPNNIPLSICFIIVKTIGKSVSILFWCSKQIACTRKVLYNNRYLNFKYC